MGYLLLKRAALPRWRATESFWKILLVSTLSSSPVWQLFLALSLPGDAMRQVTPLRGAGRLSPACFRAPRLCQAACRACPGTAAASFTMATGLTTVTSRAASLPWAQWGRNTSAGLPPSPGSKALPSLVGPRQAALAVLKSSSLSQFCRATIELVSSSTSDPSVKSTKHQ